VGREAVVETQAVPFLDLRPVHAPLRDAILDDLAQLIDSGSFVLGAAVARFEEAFAAYCNAPDCVGVASGLDALRLALLAAGIEPGDEVVVPAQTFVATLEAVTQAGGVPVIADVSLSDYCLDPDAAAAAVTGRTRFVMPVDLYGQVADIDAFLALARARGLTVVEDACQAHGASRNGRRAGELATAAFSFYPAKNLGAFGDAGALTSTDSELASRVRMYREHGQTQKYVHLVEGYTARLDAAQALVLHRKLAYLDEWNNFRRAAAAFYLDALDGVGDLTLPPVAPGSEPVWHLFVVRTAEPDRLAAFLASRNISSGRHYPIPPHLSPAYARLGHAEGSFPNAEAISREGLSLPIFPGISESQLEHVVDSVRAYFA
jgi:dTDP-3-amino-3,4,6-trideoxy-alpha-D-glucose transaminase